MGTRARRTVGQLSTARVRTAQPKPGRSALMIADGGNLYLQVTRARGADSTLRRSWTFRYEIDGRRREMGLGPLHTIGLSEARDRARTLRQQLLDGIDPLTARRAGRQVAAKAVTFKQCATAYIAAYRPGWRNSKHAGQWVTSLATYAEPIIGAVPVNDIDTALVLKVLEPIWTKTPETASRVRGRIEAVLNWAKARGYREGENPARWRGHIDHLLPKKSKLRKVKHHDALPYTEVPGFMRTLRQQDGAAAKALEFLIYTAARSGEIVGATWDEINTIDKIWTVPGSRMKGGREHRVPLSSAAIALLKALPRNGDRVFACGKTTLRGVTRKMQVDAVPHGFRSSFRTWAAERSNFPREVVEAALAHAIADKTEAAYQRGDLFEKRHRLMQAWADFCGKPAPAGATVTAIGRARRA
jgi:integrase